MPWCRAVRTTTRTAAFIPPASPPLVSTAMLDGLDAWSVMRVAKPVSLEPQPRAAGGGSDHPDDPVGPDRGGLDEFGVALIGAQRPRPSVLRRFTVRLVPAYQPLPADVLGGSEKPDLSLIHISEPTRRTPISYAVFCLKKK